MARRPLLLVMVLAVLAAASPASAYDPPELFVRTAHVDTPGPWIPLASAPTLDWIGGYQVGYRVQGGDAPGDRQNVGLIVTGVPDGAVTQPRSTPYCGIAGVNPGDIVSVQEQPIQFEGNGTYSVSVSIGPNRNTGPQDCFAGPTSAGSFRVSSMVAPEIVGQPIAAVLQDNPFVGARAPAAPGGDSEVVCALGGTAGADGALSGRFLNGSGLGQGSSLRGNFPEPGGWTCVARGAVEGDADTSFTKALFTTPWSAPLRFKALADFRRVGGKAGGRRSGRPTLQFGSEFPTSTAGLRAKLVLKKLVRCRGAKPVARRGQTVTGRFDAKGKITLKVKKPRDTSLYFGYLTVIGGDLLRERVDPRVVQVAQVKGRFGFVGKPNAFTPCD